MRQTILAIVALGILTSPALADKLTLNPVAQKTIETVSEDDSVILVQFSPPAALDGARIIRAKLHVPLNCVTGGERTYRLETAPSGWTGTTVDWAWWETNRATGVVDRAHGHAEPCEDDAAEFDVARWVRDWVESTTNTGLVIQNAEDNVGDVPVGTGITLTVVYRPSS